MPTKLRTVDEYLAGIGTEQRAALERLRRIVRAVAPETRECISYGIPAFRLDGKMLIYLGAAAEHCAIYGVEETRKGEFDDYDTSGRGTLRFTPDRPLPEDLVRRLVTARMAKLAGQKKEEVLMSDTVRSMGWGLLGGLAAGVLDIVFACSFWAISAGVPARRVLQSVAAGLLGKASFHGGWATAGLGLALHLAIAVAMALAYWLLARPWPLLVHRPWHCGALYGLVLYGIMTFVVLPLSATGPSPKDATWVVLSLAAHVLLVGWPIALFSRHALS